MALDIATNCGIAIGDSSGKPESFSVRLKRRGQGPEIAAFNMLAFLRDTFLVAKPDVVCIEEFLNRTEKRSFDSVILQLKCHGAAEAACGAFGVLVKTANVSTIRKHFCGRANAGDRASTKRMVLDRAKILGYLPKDCEDDNRADAIAVWEYACAKYARVRIPDALVLFGARLP